VRLFPSKPTTLDQCEKLTAQTAHSAATIPFKLRTHIALCIFWIIGFAGLLAWNFISSAKGEGVSDRDVACRAGWGVLC